MKRPAAAMGAAVIGSAAAAYLLVVRPWQLRRHPRRRRPHPQPDLVATRAITVHAAADQVWPWIAQLGQGRGGFYSYDALENLVGSTSTAPTASCLNGRTSRSGTRSTSTRR
jgi:hypothetical protein